MKLDKKNIISLIVLITLIILAAIFFQKYLPEFKKISEVSVKYVFILAFFTLLTIFLNAIRIKMLAGFYNIQLKKREWFGLSAVTTMANYLVPFKGGTSVKAIYLKKIHNFPYTSFATTIGAVYIVSFFVYAVAGIVISLMISAYYSTFNMAVFIMLLIVFVSTASVMLFSPKLKERKNKMLNRLVTVANEWRIMRKNRKFISKLVVLETSAWLVMSGRLYYAFQALNYDISFLFCLFIAILSLLSAIVGITPANLGIREAVIAFSSKLLGASLVMGAYAAALDRAIAMIFVFLLGSIFSYVLAKHK